MTTIKQAILECAPLLSTEAEVVQAVCHSLKCKPGSVRNAMQRLRMDGHLDHLERGQIHHKGRSQEGHGWRFGD